MEGNGGSVLYEFTGVFEHALDVKGRLTLPSDFRGHINHTQPAKITINFDRKSIAIYPLPAFRKFLDRLNRLPRTNPQAESVRRIITALTYDCEVDRQGRLIVTPKLREVAGIRREVAVVGNIEKVDLWDRARWNESFSSGLDQLPANSLGLDI